MNTSYEDFDVRKVERTEGPVWIKKTYLQLITAQALMYKLA
jgi:hypothetical protein